MPARRGQDRRCDGAVVDLGTEPTCSSEALGTRVGREHLVTAQDQHLDPEAPDRSGADDEHAAVRHELGRAQHARERLDPHAVMVAHGVGQGHAMARAQPLREPARLDPQLTKLAARRLMTGKTALAGAARDAMHHRDASAVLELARDLVTEHGPGRARGRASRRRSRTARTPARARAGPAPAGSGMSASSGRPSESRTTARTALS